MLQSGILRVRQKRTLRDAYQNLYVRLSWIISVVCHARYIKPAVCLPSISLLCDLCLIKSVRENSENLGEFREEHELQSLIGV